MKILSHLHGYPPEHNAGAEWMLHRMHKFLLKQGHEIRVVIPDVKTKTFEGIEVFKEHETPSQYHYKWADIVLSHLKKTGDVLNKCRFYEKPMVFMVHNAHNYGTVRIRPSGTYVVYNAEWIKQHLKYPQPNIVCRPPVFVEDFAPPPFTKYENKEGAITLLNLWEHKGGKILQKLAKRMPDYKFIGVIGSYGEQEIKRKIKNIEYVEHTSDIKSVFDRTRILIMPVRDESYGMAAVEAMAARIPVIATKTKGAIEAMGDAGYLLPQKDTEAWIDTIKSLDDEDTYIAACKRAAKRAKELDPTEELLGMEKFFIKIIQGKFIKRYNGKETRTTTKKESSSDNEQEHYNGQETDTEAEVLQVAAR